MDQQGRELLKQAQASPLDSLPSFQLELHSQRQGISYPPPSPHRSHLLSTLVSHLFSPRQSRIKEVLQYFASFGNPEHAIRYYKGSLYSMARERDSSLQGFLFLWDPSTLRWELLYDPRGFAQDPSPS